MLHCCSSSDFPFLFSKSLCLWVQTDLHWAEEGAGFSDRLLCPQKQLCFLALGHVAACHSLFPEADSLQEAPWHLALSLSSSLGLLTQGNPSVGSAKFCVVPFHLLFLVSVWAPLAADPEIRVLV